MRKGKKEEERGGSEGMDWKGRLGRRGSWNLDLGLRRAIVPDWEEPDNEGDRKLSEVSMEIVE